jgi:hypothetical protein
MEQGPYREADRFAASQEIPHNLWNPKAHYRIHNWPPLVSILSQFNPVNTLTSHFLTSALQNLMFLFQLLRSYQSFRLIPRLCLWIFHNRGTFSPWAVLSPSPNLQMEDHPLSAAREDLFRIFTAALLIGDSSSIRNMMTCHAVVTGTHSLITG